MSLPPMFLAILGGYSVEFPILSITFTVGADLDGTDYRLKVRVRVGVWRQAVATTLVIRVIGARRSAIFL